MQARFYLPMYGRFASPDPARDQHFEETQSWNIYSYVQNSPVMHFDPDGEMLVCASMNSADRAAYNKAIAYLMRDPGQRANIEKLQKSDNIYTVFIVRDGNDRFVPSEQNIYWDPNSALAVVDNSGYLTGGTQTPAMGLGHEIDHAVGSETGTMQTGNDKVYGKNGKEEKRVIEGSEAAAAKTLKEGKRTNHYGVSYESTGPKSTKPTKKGQEKIEKHRNEYKQQKPVKLKIKNEK